MTEALGADVGGHRREQRGKLRWRVAGEPVAAVSKSAVPDVLAQDLAVVFEEYSSCSNPTRNDARRRPGVELDGVFIRREDAERFIEEVRGDEPEIAAKLRVEGRDIEAGVRSPRMR